MKKIYIVISLAIILLVACEKKAVEEKKPFGAVDIEYDKVEGINDEGPTMAEFHSENTPPFSDGSITYVEEGPPRIETPDKMEPTADLEEEPDYGGIPLVTKE